MDRPTPPADFLTGVYSRNPNFLKSLHNGLIETPMKEFYPVINFDDLTLLQFSTWDERDGNYSQFLENIEDLDVYQILRRAYDNHVRDFHGMKRVPEKWKTLDDQLNPHKKKDLRQRLECVPASAHETLIDNLAKRTRKYVSEAQYHLNKQARRHTDKQMYVLHLPKTRLVNMTPEEIQKFYASTVARLLEGHPQEIQPLQKELF